MRRICLIALLLAGCVQQNPPTTLTAGPEIVAATQAPVWSITPGKGASKSMSVLNWRATVTNVGQSQSERLAISCLDDKGEIRSEWDVECKLMPGQTITKQGSFDIPESEVLKIKKLVVSLVTDLNG